MKLNIKNFAKMKEANVVIDGITVIAGENNTGKSTVGKILFALFNSLSNVEERIFEERFKEMESTNRTIIQNGISGVDIPRSMKFRSPWNLARKINVQIRKVMDVSLSISNEMIYEIVENVAKSWWESTESEVDYEWSDMVADITQNIREIMNLPEKVIVLEIISRYFNNVFHSQIQPLTNGENTEAALVLDIKGKKEKIVFADNYCKDLVDDVKIIHKAIYIDNPFIIDELSGYQFDAMNPMSEILVDLLTSKTQESVMDGVIETIRAKEKLNDIYETLQNVVSGEVFMNQSNEEYYLKNNDFSEPISLCNLSAGMKSFVILKILLEKGCLKEKDVVILDEPEIHLHPQWQIAYAELIVLLQKHFDLSVVVTTHSPYFVDAINLFSCKYETDSKVNYYLSSNNGSAVSMECVTDKIDSIYKKMASPIQMLDTLRYELNNN
ncbi:MAG: ATP-binding protein [Eubacterium sp.]|nr:ATP-binding protein [Eubacterium sp.]